MGTGQTGLNCQLQVRRFMEQAHTRGFRSRERKSYEL